MSSFDLVINGKTVKANYGETLVEAGLSGWVAIPHDCNSGQCETCLVNVVSGQVDDFGTAEKNTVLACQAKVIGNAAITFDHVPDVAKRSGLVTGIAVLTSDIVEVTVMLGTPIDFRPGQYLSVKFAGFPARELSPTVRPDGTAAPGELVFHIRRYPGGLVSTQIGATIRAGHRVQVRGPFGSAFLRDGDGPIVLIGGGTGWAPIWSVAAAARREQRHRDLVVIAGSRDAEGLYMRRSLEWLIDDGVREVIATAEVGAVNGVRRGRPTHYLPSLGPEDTVYVAGPPPLVDAVKMKSRLAAARCYADPFLPNAQPLSFIDRVMAMLRRPAAAPVETPRPAVATMPAPRGRPQPATATTIPPLPAAAPRRSQAGSR
ncbi:MAG: 2Fe-2S iron-sulfur cluster binding domain-containing protein [Alphaproteobacteria bacterium]|nr:MAG: 2Fe-2S iron-sulfur cluster binding domain-containing protein [Alphaproteobacteria bacterium]